MLIQLHHFPFPFLPPKTPIHLSLSHSNPQPFFSMVVKYTHTPKYSLLRLPNVICMHVYKADHLALSDHLVCASLRNIISSAESIP